MSAHAYSCRKRKGESQSLANLPLGFKILEVQMCLDDVVVLIYDCVGRKVQLL